MSGGPDDPSDPGRLNWENVTLRDVIESAYDLKEYQLTGPDWMNSSRFNIAATLPPGTSKENFALMVQTLLKDRFALASHRETKELPAFALTVAKGGPKLPVATDDPPEAAPVAGGRGGRGGGLGPLRNGMIMVRPGGHIAAKGIPVADFGEALSRLLDRPVVDQTGLTGKYDFKLDYTPDETTQVMSKGMPVPRPENGDGLVTVTDAGGASLFTAVQAQLGLKLEGKKLPFEFLVVDHLEKTPTEN